MHCDLVKGSFSIITIRLCLCSLLHSSKQIVLWFKKKIEIFGGQAPFAPE